MVLRPLRTLPPRPNAALADAWLEQLGAALADPTLRSRRCSAGERSTELAYPQYAANWETAVDDARCRWRRASRSARSIRATSRSSRSTTPSATTSGSSAVKPLLWLWYSFDRTADRRAERRARRQASPPARAAHLQALRRELQGVPARRVLVRLQHGGRRQRRGAPPRAARRPRRDRAWATTCRSATTRTSTATRTASSISAT